MKGRPSSEAIRLRVLELRAKEPELDARAIAQRLGLHPNTVRELAKASARPVHLAVGDRVRVSRRGPFFKRTGLVIELPGFPFRDHRRVRLDATETDPPVRAMLFPLEDLKFVERTGQIPLFEVST